MFPSVGYRRAATSAAAFPDVGDDDDDDDEASLRVTLLFVAVSDFGGHARMLLKTAKAASLGREGL